MNQLITNILVGIFAFICGFGFIFILFKLVIWAITSSTN